MASLGLCLCDRLVSTFPQRKQQRTDAFAFLLRADKFVLGHARIRRMQSSSLMIRSHWSTAYPPPDWYEHKWEQLIRRYRSQKL